MTIDLEELERLQSASAVPAQETEDQFAEFEVTQDGMVVASASGPRKRALQEAQHYAAVYGQDGPTEIREASATAIYEPPKGRV